MPCVLLAALARPVVAAAHGPSKVGQLVPPAARVDGRTGGEASGGTGLEASLHRSPGGCRTRRADNEQPVREAGTYRKHFGGPRVPARPGAPSSRARPFSSGGSPNTCSDVEEESVLRARLAPLSGADTPSVGRTYRTRVRDVGRPHRRRGWAHRPDDTAIRGLLALHAGTGEGRIDHVLRAAASITFTAWARRGCAWPRHLPLAPLTPS